MKFIISLFLIICSTVGFSQEKPTERLIGFNHLEVAAAFVVIEKTYQVKLSYTDRIVANKTIFLPKKKRTLQEVLEALSNTLHLDFQFINNRYIVVTLFRENVFDEDSEKLNEIVINSYLAKGITKNKDASFVISPKKLELLPGLVEADVLESIQELPGVISPNETATGLNVRGGTADQNQIIWDGINIYHNGHLFGMLSTFNPNITQRVTFYEKGVPPKYGDRISSVIDIATTKKVAKALKVEAGLNGVSADFNIEVPIIKDKLSFLYAFRKSYQGIYETNTFKQIEEKVFQSTNIHVNDNENKFYFKDYNFKINFTPNKKNTFSFSLIHIDNDLEDLRNEEATSLSYKDILDTENDGYSLYWNKKWSDHLSQTTEISHSHYSLYYDFLTYKNNNLFSDFDKKNNIKDTRFSSEINLKMPSKNRITIGYQMAYKDVDYSFLEIKNNVLYELDMNKNQVTTQGFFANYINRSFSGFNFDAGIRLNYYTPFNQLKFEPRLVLLKKINNRFKIQLTGEIRNQIISQIEETVLSNLTLENKLWRLANNNDAPIINSKQVSAGAIYTHKGWTVDLDSYYKKVKGITALSLGFLSGANSERFHKGTQDITGVDFYLKKNFNHVKTWLSYSYIDINNNFDHVNNDNDFTASNEIQHAISSSIAYKTKKFQIALGWKWHTGKPYTISSINPNNNTVVFDAINTGRLPSYHRLDFSSVYHFTFSEKHHLKGKIGISIRNLLGTKKLLSREYTGNNIPNDPIVKVDYFSVGRMPNFVFRIFW